MKKSPAYCVLQPVVDEDLILARAVSFLPKIYSVSKVGKPVLMDDVWLVDIFVSKPREMKFQIKVNPKTGYIVGF